MLLEKPKRLPTSATSRSGLITASLVETKTANQPQVTLREGQKPPSGIRPVSFPSTTSDVGRSGDGQNRQSLKMRNLPLVLPLSNEPKHDSSAPASKGITSPLKYIMKPTPTPFSSTRVSLCTKEFGKNGLGLLKTSGSFNARMEESTLKTARTEVQQTGVTNAGLPDHSAPPSPIDSLTDSSSGSVTHFFDQRVLSTLEKAKRKLCHRNLLVCGRPKGFVSSKAQARHTEAPPSPAASESCHPETSPLKVNGISHGKLQSCGIFYVDAYECLQLYVA